MKTKKDIGKKLRLVIKLLKGEEVIIIVELDINEVVVKFESIYKLSFVIDFFDDENIGNVVIKSRGRRRKSI